MPRRICRNMRLINPAHREKLTYSFVSPLHSLCVIAVIGAFMLIYKYAIFGKSIEAVAVKFACEKSLARSEGVCAVNNYKVIAVSLVRTNFSPSSKCSLTLLSSSFRQSAVKTPAHVNNSLIYFNHSQYFQWYYIL